MKIAFVSTVRYYAWGGSDTMWTRAAEAAVARGDSLLLGLSPLTVEHARIQALIAQGARLVLRPRVDLPRTRGTRLKESASRKLGLKEPLIGSLDRFRPDLVVISCGGTYDPLIERQLREWLRKSQTAYHIVANFQVEVPELSEADRLLIADWFAGAREISFVSQRNLEVTRRHLLHALPNGRVRHNPLQGSGNPLEWPASDTLRFATLGRLEPVKGLDLLIHAMKTALGNETGWELNVHGTGRDETYLRRVISHVGLEDRVRLAGFTADLDQMWRTHHLLLSPAVNEGVPMTIPEAMLRARPAAATAVGGAHDWLEENRSGFIAPAATVPALVELLRAAWAARDRWREMGRHGAARARSFYRPTDYLALIEPL